MQEYLSDLLRQWRLPPYAWNLILVGGYFLLGLLLGLLLTFLVRKQSFDTGSFVLGKSLLRNLAQPFSIWLPLFVFDLLIPLLRATAPIRQRISHVTEIGLILASAFVIVRMVRVAQDLAHYRINVNTPDNLRQRRILTQLIYIRRVINVIVILITIGAVLLTFSTMRKIGTGLLTGVGIGGIIIGFGAQRSLGNLLAGFQIAFTQPIRIDDEVVVEGEFGWIEEITLTYIVVRIWDERRLILPITYFIEKPFQNWTRTRSDMLGTVFLYSDYTLPIDWLRNEVSLLLKDQPLWDGRKVSVAVTNLTAEVMETRIVISGANSGNVWDLRAYLREHLIRRISEQYPDSLPHTRAELKSDNNREREA